MTRLTKEDLDRIPKNLEAYDEELKTVIGLELTEIALKTSKMNSKEFTRRVSELKGLAVVPTTIGQGVLAGFSSAIARIGRHLGFSAAVTKSPDMAGLGEAVTGGSEILFCADDKTCLALNLISRRVVDNSSATGQVYAAALLITGRQVLDCPIGIVGLGPVGLAAAKWLCSRDHPIIVHDWKHDIQCSFLEDHPSARGAESIEVVLAESDHILEATNSSNIIKVAKLDRHLTLAAPGMPLGVDDPNSDKISLIHDPLQLGVAAMLVQVLE